MMFFNLGSTHSYQSAAPCHALFELPLSQLTAKHLRFEPTIPGPQSAPHRIGYYALGYRQPGHTAGDLSQCQPGTSQQQSPELPNIPRLSAQGGTCATPLGMESGAIPDAQLTAGTAHDPGSVGPQHARLNSEAGGGAWCPKFLIHNQSTEYLEIRLLRPHWISQVLTQGRFAQGQGQEFAPFFALDYWNPHTKSFQSYSHGVGRVIFSANSNTYSVVSHPLNRPILTDRLRILPYSPHPRTICMRVELMGCLFQSGNITEDAELGFQADEPFPPTVDALDISPIPDALHPIQSHPNRDESLLNPWNFSGLVGLSLGAMGSAVLFLLIVVGIKAYTRVTHRATQKAMYTSFSPSGSFPSLEKGTRNWLVKDNTHWRSSGQPGIAHSESPIYSVPTPSTLEQAKMTYFGLSPRPWLDDSREDRDNAYTLRTGSPEDLKTPEASILTWSSSCGSILRPIGLNLDVERYANIQDDPNRPTDQALNLELPFHIYASPDLKSLCVDDP
eukprot:maker-scaffold353_size198981-snap-gene-0.34 protein:Tk05253 transcript:maker-scaffold353_size198981-snap-gene-0.34-mRNA-1 annotation:"GA16357"